MIYDNLGVLLGAIIATLTPYITSWISKKLKKDNFLPNLDIRKKIKLEIEKLLIETGASRVSIVEFSNTDVSISGLPFNYANMTYEATGDNTKEIITGFQKIPISLYADMLISLESSREQCLLFTDKDPNSSISMINKIYGCKSTYKFKITNTVKDGIIRLEWNNEYSNLTSEQIESVKLYVMKIRMLKQKLRKH
jgi:hypothetical protein